MGLSNGATTGDYSRLRASGGREMCPADADHETILQVKMAKRTWFKLALVDMVCEKTAIES